jgi:hypothetical protein
MKYIATMLVAFSMSGCMLLTDPSQPDVVFSYMPADEAVVPQAHDHANGLLVMGTMRAPCMPYEARPALDVTRNSVNLRIIGRPGTGCVQQAEGLLEYSAGVSLRTGSYNVRVTHEWQDGSWPRETVIDTVMTAGTAVR